MAKTMSIILPIKSKYVKAIFAGTKKFELRRKIPKQDVKSIYIYETSPTSKIVGKLMIKKIWKFKIKKLWEHTKGQNELSKQELESYFHNQDHGFALEISKKEQFQTYQSIQKYNLNYPPQGFVYVKKTPK